jgi:nitrate reductase NapD
LFPRNLKSEELHIAGIVVHAYPESVQRVAGMIERFPGAEVHAVSRDGKLVVTLEAPTSREVAARIESIQKLDAVLSASLVYQHNEALQAMMEEVSHEAHKT